MFTRWWRSLAFRLFVSYLLVILIGALTLSLTAEWSAPVAFERHLRAMGEMMGRMMGPMHRMDLNADLYGRFRQALHEALAWSLLASAVGAALVSWVVARRVLAPLQHMRRATQRIAEGHYEERVPVPGSPDHPDELGELALHFNRMAERLAQTETLRRRLIGDVAHELRTPLTTIQGYLEGLMDGVLEPDQATYRLIYDEVRRLHRLVEDLQELSRVEEGAFRLQMRPEGVADLLAEAVQRWQAAYAEKGVRLAVEVPPHLPLVLADTERVQQVLNNLLANALRYTPAGGQVTLSAHRQGEMVAIAVRDTGIGIPAEHLPHLFERFYRGDPSRSRAHGGSGIGLTIARGLVEAHGGRIWAESDGPGKGSCFTFTLPIAPRGRDGAAGPGG